jgi:hypothetical protein
VGTVRKLAYSAATLLTAGAVVVPTVAASASMTPQPPKPKAEVVTVIEKGRPAKALEAFGFRVLVGQQTWWIKASDFIVHQAKDGSFTLEYAPNGNATGMYLMTGPRGSILVRNQTLATSLREGRPDLQGYAELFTVQAQGHRITVLYLNDFRGQLIEAPAAYWHHAPQPTEWKLVPAQGYHLGW